MAQFDKTKPAGSQKVRLSDDDIRSNNDALEDAIGRDHKFPTGYGTDAGEHLQVKFNAPITSPTAVTNKCFVFPKDVAGKVELHFLDEDGNEIQLTSVGQILGNPIKVTPISTPTDAANMGFYYGKDVGGKIEAHFLDEDGNEVQITSAGSLNVPVATDEIPAGTKMWFYANSAPTGWTIDSTPSDELLAIKGGSTYTAGGTTAGSWTITAAGSVSGTTGAPSATFLSYRSGDGAYYHPEVNHTHSFSGSTSVSSSTNRIKARVGIICSKDA